jgi:tetratricopeptide (TPR) repeat protein
MHKDCKEKLDQANKLIFVRRYEEAQRLLNDALRLPECAAEGLVHLRRVELMSLLGKLPELEDQYRREIQQKGDKTGRLFHLICRLFSMDHGDDLHSELIHHLQDFGPSAGIYFALGYEAEQSENLDRAKAYYEQSIAQDPDWFPSLFGLSQVNYTSGDEAKGDQYFHQFENLAPFNVYGNFETHRRLSQEFYLKGDYEGSERAIQMLTTWWLDNKGYAPAEIQVYELLATYRIAEVRGDHTAADTRKEKAIKIASELMNSGQADEQVLYFLARVLDEFGEQHLAFQAYKKVLLIAGRNTAVVQKIGSHFLGREKIDQALELFEHAYSGHPDNPEIRFCLLVARLKKAGVSVEEYLIGRERLRQLADYGDRVELLGLLNTLLQKFEGDWDVHFHLAELFLKMGHPAKAAIHYKRMFELDSKGQSSRLRYANFLMVSDRTDDAMDILKSMPQAVGLLTESDAEIQWLRVTYFDRKGNWSEALDHLRPLLEKDCWNISYLMQEIVALSGQKYGKEVAEEARATWFKKLNAAEETKINWAEFARDTAKISGEHAYGLVYARRKLHFLYAKGSDDALRAVVKAASAYDASKGARDLMRLLNTNLDTPSVYWGLGLLYKELWQLEVASMWFEHTLHAVSLDDQLRSRVYAELADTYVWRNAQLPKAIEYCRLSLELGERQSSDEVFVMTVMAHALLKSGQPRQAGAFLEQLLSSDSASYEVRYLAGLIHYRNGHPKEANQIWKPLLKFRSEIMRDHKIKQEILKYYFEGNPYKPADLSKAN